MSTTHWTPTTLRETLKEAERSLSLTILVVAVFIHEFLDPLNVLVCVVNVIGRYNSNTAILSTTAFRTGVVFHQFHSSVQSRSPSPTAETLGEGHHAISLVETSVHSGETKISDMLRPEAPTPKLFTRAIFNINLLSFDDIFISVGMIADHT